MQKRSALLRAAFSSVAPLFFPFGFSWVHQSVWISFIRRVLTSGWQGTSEATRKGHVRPTTAVATWRRPYQPTPPPPFRIFAFLMTVGSTVPSCDSF